MLTLDLKECCKLLFFFQRHFQVAQDRKDFRRVIRGDQGFFVLSIPCSVTLSIGLLLNFDIICLLSDSLFLIIIFSGKCAIIRCCFALSSFFASTLRIGPHFPTCGGVFRQREFCLCWSRRRRCLTG